MLCHQICSTFYLGRGQKFNKFGVEVIIEAEAGVDNEASIFRAKGCSVKADTEAGGRVEGVAEGCSRCR